MSPATAAPTAQTYTPKADVDADVTSTRAPATIPPGRFRLVHYVGLVAVVFVLALVIVWQQASAVRLGYMIEEGERDLENAHSDCDRMRMALERRTNPLALAEMVRELGLELEFEGGAGK